MTSLNLANQFLIAMPNMGDPRFYHSVTLICEHEVNGTMGVIVNHPLTIGVKELLKHLEIPVTCELDNIPVMAGGPVEPERGFVLHPPCDLYESSAKISKDLMITTSKDVLEAIGKGEGPDKVLVALGYAGWSTGQLEKELSENAWLNTAADSSLIFESDIEQRWQLAAGMMGVDMSHMSNDIGHG